MNAESKRHSRSTVVLICSILAVVAFATPETLLKGVPPLPWIVVGAAFAFAAAYFAVARRHVFAIIGAVAFLWSGVIIAHSIEANKESRQEYYGKVLPTDLPHLAVGSACPDIQATDLNGEQMNLVDHRGKVVLLVFWASWCGPCMGDVAHEKELVKRFQGRPFELIGVNGDESLAEANAAVAEHAIPWQSFWNGGSDGYITSHWGVQAWPTLYVIDDLGVIRHKSLRGRSLGVPLAQLVAEAELRATTEHDDEHTQTQ